MTTLQSPPIYPTFDNLPDHRGQPRTLPSIFFANPPADIGPLRSAESTLGNMTPGRFLLNRIVAGGVFAIIVLIVAFFIAYDKKPFNMQALEIGAAVGFGLGLIVFLALRFKAICSYVGQVGVARYTIKSQKNPQPTSEILMFADVAELLTERTRHYQNGAYTGTSYHFTWLDSNGRRLKTFRGRFSEDKKGIKAGDPYHFIAASEIAWSGFYLDRAAQQLADEGSIPFHVDKNRIIRVGPGFIEFHFDKTPVRVTKEEIESFSLAKGQFSFKHKDAKWYSSAGKYSFPYAKMANARVFMMSLERVMGYRIN